MTWAALSEILRRHSIVCAATAAVALHAVAGFALLSGVKFSPKSQTPIAVSMSVIELPPAPVTPPPQPAVETIAPVIDEAPKARPPPDPVTPAPAPSPPEIDKPIRQIAAGGARDTNVAKPSQTDATAPISDRTATDTVHERAVAALQSLKCRQLGATSEDPADCPKADPLNASSDPKPQTENVFAGGILTDPFPPQNAVESMLARNQAPMAKMLNGEDNSIFYDPMPAGSYRAQQIRNGKDRVFDRETEQALRAMRRD